MVLSKSEMPYTLISRIAFMQLILVFFSCVSDRLHPANERPATKRSPGPSGRQQPDRHCGVRGHRRRWQPRDVGPLARRGESPLRTRWRHC
uniref:Transposon protein n=1 Tax=Arundo donax TaxID=35708 RepID=A0A0A8XRS6_ARUDO